jgi:hypothetical protein
MRCPSCANEYDKSSPYCQKCGSIKDQTLKQKHDQIMKAQAYAVSIEHDMRKIFGCDRGGFGGMVDSKSIRQHPFLLMTQTLAFLYAIKPEKKDDIETFIQHFSIYSELSMDDMLAFLTESQTIDNATFTLEKENGLLMIEYMVEEFEKVIA